MTDLIQGFIEYKSQQENSKGKARSPLTITNYELQLRKYERLSALVRVEKDNKMVDVNKGKRNKFLLNTKDYILDIKKNVNNPAKDKNGKALYLKGGSFKTHLATIKSFLDYLVSEKDMEVPLIKFDAYKKSVNVNKSKKLWLNDDALEKLQLHIRDLKQTSLRDRLIFEIALSTGSRRTEIQSLRLCDITAKDFDNGSRGYFIAILRKGKNIRESIRIHDELYHLINMFSKVSDSESHLFSSKKALAGEGLNLSYMTQLVKKVSSKALGYAVSPHELRHTAINRRIIFSAKQGKSMDYCLSRAQEMAGHSDRSTTENHYFNAEIKGMFATLSDSDESISFYDF